MKKLMVLVLGAAFMVAAAGSSFALKKDIAFKTVGDEGTVVFSHALHTETAKIKCNQCHPKLFQMRHVDISITMGDIADGKYCGSCHDGTKAISGIDPDKCVLCHKKAETPPAAPAAAPVAPDASAAPFTPAAPDSPK